MEKERRVTASIEMHCENAIRLHRSNEVRGAIWKLAAQDRGEFSSSIEMIREVRTLNYGWTESV